MKKMIKITAIITVLFSVLNITAFANAGPGFVEGTDAFGVITRFENCPITVEKEVLTFDINNPPTLDFYHDEWLAEYADKVTAEYTFYNPTEYDIKAALYFPFHNINEYVEEYDNQGNLMLNRGTDKYDITVNGQAVEENIRFTYSSDEFNAYSDIKKLKDGYINHSFFTADLPVTKYVYRDSAYGTEENVDRDFQLDWENKDNKTAILVADSSSWHSTGERSGKFGINIYGDEEIVIYLFGRQPDSPLQVKGYIANGLTANLYRTSEMTFEQFVLEEYAPWNEETGISQQDWYNIHVDYIIRSTDVDKMITGMNMEYLYHLNNIMCWYEYEINIPAGESVVNTVTAPLYPLLNYEYEPYIYEYTYLLSPAKGWAEFGDIEININTPYYILENSIEGFEKTERGYTYTGNGLPEGELEFSLSTGETMPKQVHPYTKFVAAGVLVSAMIVFVVGWFMYRDVKRYEAKNGKFKG